MRLLVISFIKKNMKDMKNMIDANIKFLRKKAGLSQEELAQKLGVSRQSVAKWENGESLPDILKCSQLALLFDITVDNLINFSFEEQSFRNESTIGKYAFGMVKVGERGQIVIPKYAREIFDINPGDRLIVLGDEIKGGLALAKIQRVGGSQNFK